MQLMAFYAVRGYAPDKLAALSETEKIFLYAAMEQELKLMERRGL